MSRNDMQLDAMLRQTATTPSACRPRATSSRAVSCRSTNPVMVTMPQVTVTPKALGGSANSSAIMSVRTSIRMSASGRS